MELNARKPGVVGGLYEVAFGVPDLAEAIGYRERFGYRVGEVGRLAADAAHALYGVRSDLRSVRLYHQQSDHGLLRLMQWAHPAGEGLALAPFRCLGARWITTVTRDGWRLLNHLETLERRGGEVWFMPPVFTHSHYRGNAHLLPFADDLVGLREGAFATPLDRQVFLERFGFARPNYGAIHETCLLQCSQNVHSGVVLQDDSGAKRRFYAEGFGLTVWPEVAVGHDRAVVSRGVFALEPGEGQRVTDADDLGPPVDPIQGRSGRLKLFRFEETRALPDKRDVARPGFLGPCLYTYRVNDLARLRDRAIAAGGRGATPILADEFGRGAFSVEAPDGYVWTLVAA
ncbi:MAG: VOC family protein [Alphaproteobacteria bacterium]|nr:VOC family protein [Alphaproteobacteria bacterium]